MQYIYTVEYDSVIKRNEIMPFTATRMDPEMIILRQISYDIIYMWNLKRTIQVNLLTKQHRLIDIENKFRITKGESVEG